MSKNASGSFEPWATLVDPPGQSALGAGPQKVFLIGLLQSDSEDDWEGIKPKKKKKTN